MHCKLLKIKGSWKDVKNACRTTINKKENDVEPSHIWKRKILLAEHSPIRHISISARWYDLPYWVSTHITRHKFGVEHFVRTQRADRTGIARNELSQGSLVEHEILVDVQALINISRRRLCKLASIETREAWTALLSEVNILEPEIFGVCVPECVYRGRCTEFKTCGFSKTSLYGEYLKNYDIN
jgi:hypothetical protein